MRLIAKGALGKVLRFESRYQRWRPTIRAGWRARSAPEEAGGTLVDLGAHLVDQALQLFGPAASVYGEVDRRRPEAQVDDDAFVAITHADGTRSHLWMSDVVAQFGPRLRVLGDRAGYTKYGLDVQEAALRAGDRPNRDGWGEDPPAMFGRVGVDGDLRDVQTEPGRYQQFYADVAEALAKGAPMPADPAESLTVLEILETVRDSPARGSAVPVHTQATT